MRQVAARYRGSRGGGSGVDRLGAGWALLWVDVLDSRGGRGCRSQEKAVVLLGALGGVGSSCIAGAVRRHLEVEFTHNIENGPVLVGDVAFWPAADPPCASWQCELSRVEQMGGVSAPHCPPAAQRERDLETGACDRRPELFRVVKQRPDQHHHVCQQRAILHSLLVRLPFPWFHDIR